MDLDGQGGVTLMDGYKRSGTEGGFENGGIFAATRVRSIQPVSRPQPRRQIL